MKLATLALSCASILGLAACDTAPKTAAYYRPAPTFEEATANPFIKSSRDAIARLVAGLDTTAASPVLVATIVDVNDLRKASALGRTLSEQFGSAMVSNGFNVKELKLRGDVFVRETTGELLLSREIKDIAQIHKASTVLVGTYSVASQYTYVNLKLLRTDTGQILRAHDYALPNNQDIQSLSR